MAKLEVPIWHLKISASPAENEDPDASSNRSQTVTGSNLRCQFGISKQHYPLLCPKNLGPTLEKVSTVRGSGWVRSL
jgi:hypothetical protein